MVLAKAHARTMAAPTHAPCAMERDTPLRLRSDCTLLCLVLAVEKAACALCRSPLFHASSPRQFHALVSPGHSFTARVSASSASAVRPSSASACPRRLYALPRSSGLAVSCSSSA